MKIFNKVLLAALAGLFFCFPPKLSWAQENTEKFLMPGRTGGEGTYFEVKNGQHLDISLDSSEKVKILLESIPEIIKIIIEPISPATSTRITLGGLAALTTYYQYQDNYHNLVEFITDENGSYAYTQDISIPRLVFIQSQKSTKFITDNATGGDCAALGSWSANTKTCTLNTDVNETIQIDSDNIILDGNGHTVAGAGNLFGVLVSHKTGVIIKNLVVKGFSDGISFFYSSGNTISDNTVLNNFYGIGLYHSRDNIVNSNTADSNSFGGILAYSGYGNIIENNLAKNSSYYGILLDYSGGNKIVGNTNDSNEKHGLLLGFYCIENHIINNLFSRNKQFGLFIFQSSNQNKVYHNNFIDNFSQVAVSGGFNNLFDNGYPDGGNYWNDFDEPTEGCVDENDDGFCDASYVFWGGQDNYPFVREFSQARRPDWSFAIITDLHVGQYFPNRISPDYGTQGWDDGNSGSDENAAVKNLEDIVELINSETEKYKLKFVVVTGDFTDSAEMSEFYKAKNELNSLKIPWIPIIGNHDVWPHYGMNPDPINREAEMAPKVGELLDTTDRYFNNIFKIRFKELSMVFQGWENAEKPVFDNSLLLNSYYQNFYFDFEGYHFIGLDFNSRGIEKYKAKGAAAEGDLHNFSDDFKKGTLPWLAGHLNQYIEDNPDGGKNIILFAHHPFRINYFKEYYGIQFYNIGFSDGELNVLKNSLVPYQDRIYALFAGHTHENKITTLSENGIKTIETAANVNNPLARIVQFYPDGRINYSKMLGFGMRITAHSPIDLEVIDPDGFVISKKVNQVEGARYNEEDIDGDGDMEDSIFILKRKMGDYQIRIIPEPDAALTNTYSLEVSTLEDDFGYVPIILAQDVPVSGIPAGPYVFQSKEKQATQIVYGGDLSGQYSDQINLAASLGDAEGNPLVNKEVSFAIGEQSINATTNASGHASAVLRLEQAEGEYYLAEVSFAGNKDYLPAFDSKQFKIKKKGTIITATNAEGFSFDDITLEAQILNADGDALIGGPYEVAFKVGEETIGAATIGKNGEAKIDWHVDLIPKEITDDYSIAVSFADNDYYLPAQGEAVFTLKSPQWLKNNAIIYLKANSASNKLLVNGAIKHIQNSLDDKYWLDSSHLIFLENCQIGESDIDNLDLEKDFNPASRTGKKIKCFLQNSGLKVFLQEYLAVKLMDNFAVKLKSLDKAKLVFKEAIANLVKADKLLAQIVLNEARDIQSSDAKINKMIEHLLIKAEKQFDRAEEEIAKHKPDKAIIRLAISWLYGQLAIKFIN